jgi:hypothetical protein
MTTAQPTLDSLVYDWGSAYDIGYQDDQWIAARRDGRAVLLAETLTKLDELIQADYRHEPVPRAFDPPHTSDDSAGQDRLPDQDESFLLAALRASFPAWAIEYNPDFRAWVAHNQAGIICENSAVLLCAALLLVQRRSGRTNGPP